MIMTVGGLGPDPPFGVDIPETTYAIIRPFRPWRATGTTGLVNELINDTYDSFGSSAVAVQWQGTPCAPPPQKGREQRCHQMNRTGLSGWLSGIVDHDRGRFPNQVVSLMNRL